MSVSTRDLKRRIRSVGNTRKITKAMELVASVKMRKAIQAVVASRPYTDRAWEMLLHLASRTQASEHPLLRQADPIRNVAVIAVASNRGLVGPFNSQLLGAVHEFLKSLPQPSISASVILLGAKGRSLRTQFGHEISAEFIKDDIVTQTTQLRPVTKMAIDGFRAGHYDQVVVGYMDYVSSLAQKPRVRQILPLSSAALFSDTAGVFEKGERQEVIRAEQSEEQEFEYKFEPDADVLLEHLLPRLVEMQVYRAVLETNASEHAARMVAMKNATDSAGELIDDLTLSFNQVRQSAITQDLAEISASRTALES